MGKRQWKWLARHLWRNPVGWFKRTTKSVDEVPEGTTSSRVVHMPVLA
jgi:hypothetical protein